MGVHDINITCYAPYPGSELFLGLQKEGVISMNEEYFYTEDGTMANSSFLDYRMPTTLDIPMIDTVIIEVPNPRHPYGLRGVGEVPIIPPLAALGNAVSHAAGVRIRKLPISPGSVLEAMENKS